MARVLINVPKTARVGEAVEIKVLISHPMESGQRRGEDGQAIPRQIINKFVCTWNGEEVVSLELFPAISANPFFAFSALADRSGTIGFSWVDDDGAVQSQLSRIEVT